MAGPVFYRRFAERRLVEALEASPVVLIHGPRQCGKTTLAQFLCAPNQLGWRGDEPSRFASGHTWPGEEYRFFSFDDPLTRDNARASAMDFVDRLPERVILADVQRVPELFEAIKITVDRRRTPGRFLLTGSANVFFVPRLSDSLAGRLRIVSLHPLSQVELENQSATDRRGSGFLSALLGDGFPVFRRERLGTRLANKIIAGGFPAALMCPTDRHLTSWYRNYVEALVQRDVHDISRIRSLDVVPTLLEAVSAQTAKPFNLSRLAAPFALSRPAIENYVILLELLFLMNRLPAWYDYGAKRLVKAPKLHLSDTGLAAALLGLDAKALATDRAIAGQLLETFVFQELRNQATWHDRSVKLSHYRDKDGGEVDIVIEQQSRAVAGVEVKAAGAVTWADFRGLRKLAKAAGDRFVRGVVLYDGENSLSPGDRLQAVPISQLWTAE